MSKVLITFLGKGQFDRNSADRKYSKIPYRLQENEEPELHSFISSYLFTKLNCDKIFVLGTTGSMWDEAYSVFASKFNKWSETDYEKLASIFQQEKDAAHVENQAVLMPLRNILPAGSWVEMLHYGTTDEELWYNLKRVLILEEKMNDGDELYIDITHSFRSFPIFFVVAIIYLSLISSKNIKVTGIYYGMMEAINQKGYAPVVNLYHVPLMIDWIEAAFSFRKYGDVTVFQKLLPPESYTDSFKSATEQFSMMLQTNDVKKVFASSKKLVDAIMVLTDSPKNYPLLLLAPQICELPKLIMHEKLEWKRQFILARKHMENNQIGLAILNAWEGVLSRFELIFGIKISEHKYHYSTYSSIIKGEKRRTEINEIDASFFKTIRQLHIFRNACAHGDRNDEINYETLQAEVKKIIQLLEQSLKNARWDTLAFNEKYLKLFSLSEEKTINENIALLNAPVVTNFGEFSFKPVSDADAKEFIIKNGFTSYIGHQSTCDILTQLLEVDVPLNRTQYTQQPGEKALIFKLKTRPPEGVVLKTIEEIENCGYEFGLLERIN